MNWNDDDEAFAAAISILRVHQPARRRPLTRARLRTDASPVLRFGPAITLAAAAVYLIALVVTAARL